MGVDVFAYRKVTFVPDDDEETVATLFVDEDLVETWPAVTKGLRAGRYLVEDDEHREVRLSPSIKWLVWRDQLASLAGYTQLAALKGEVGDVPFVELTGFGEQQGVFGPEACSNLYQDFVDFDAEAVAVSPAFYNIYASFKDAFEYAKDGGALQIA